MPAPDQQTGANPFQQGQQQQGQRGRKGALMTMSVDILKLVKTLS